MISVIVPVFKAERTIAYCIESILNQSYADFEAILVDDGSPDKSGKICDDYANSDRRLTVIHKPNGGVSTARNAGICAARGEYLTFCDSDDYLEPDYLKTLIQTKDSNPDCGHIWCSFQAVSGFQKEGAAPIIAETPDLLRFTLDEFMTLRELGLDASPVNKLYQASVVREHNLLFPVEYSLGEDLLFNLAYIDASGNREFAVITKPLYNYYRGNNDTLDTIFRPDLLEIFRSLNEKCESYFLKWNIPPQQTEKLFDSKFYQYERVLDNTMKNPFWSLTEKIKWNSMLLRSEDFRQVLTHRTCFVHPLFLKAYESGDYKRVLLVQRMRKIKRMLHK